jgi:hypothetical protein
VLVKISLGSNVGISVSKDRTEGASDGDEEGAKVSTKIVLAYFLWKRALNSEARFSVETSFIKRINTMLSNMVKNIFENNILDTYARETTNSATITQDIKEHSQKRSTQYMIVEMGLVRRSK